MLQKMLDGLELPDHSIVFLVDALPNRCSVGI